MTWFNFEGHRVWYERTGSGDPIIFLPNATLDGKLWQYQAEHFQGSNDVIVADLPGFGRSERLTPSLELWVRWVGKFVDELDLAPVVLIGNCMGSLTALTYAGRHPDQVRALVLFNTVDKDVGAAGPMGAGAGIFDHKTLRPLFEAMVRHGPAWVWKRHPGPLAHTAAAYPWLQFGKISGPRQEEYTRHAVDLFSDVETRLTLMRLGYTQDQCVLPDPATATTLPPICWIWGEANQLLPLEVGKRQLDVLHPEEVHVIPDRGYAVAFEDPEEVNPVIERFLAKHPRADRTLAAARAAGTQ